MLALWLLVGVASAAPECEPLDEATFRSLLLDAQAALDRDDAATEAQIVADVRGRVPCLTFAPSPRQWAEYLVAVAIGQFERGEDWQPAMAAALRIRPSVDRGVGPGHPLASWEPPAADATSPGKVPDGVELWVDGSPATDLPPVAGLHLVQRTKDGAWSSLLLLDEPIPPGWFVARLKKPPTWDGAVNGSLALGGAIVSQSTKWTSDYVPTDSWSMELGGISARGLATFGGYGGHFALEVPMQTGTNHPRDVAAQVDAIVHGDRLDLGVGIGVAGQTVHEGDLDRDLGLAFGDVYLATRGEEGRWDTAWSLGRGPALWRGEGRVGRSWTNGPVDRRIGGALLIQDATLTNGAEMGLTDRKGSAQLVRLSVELGLAWDAKSRKDETKK